MGCFAAELFCFLIIFNQSLAGTCSLEPRRLDIALLKSKEALT